ncbi:MAG: glycosyltransferase family 4 protein, partial [Salinicola sp.]|uniref:glycosyltransferase n=1 Tax=Salinicola sp. TaxID=1978524 RepID=UPI001E028784
SFREIFGMGSIEAAAVGCPVIGSRVDGLPETLEEGVTGLTLPCTEAVGSLTPHAGHSSISAQVYDPDTDQLRVPLGVSPALLAESVAAVLGDPERHHRMRVAGRQFVSERFTLARYVDSMTRHLQSMGAA